MHGIINLDKPKGITSHDAVTAVKRRFRVKKAGHAGTLDPIATGVLLVCLNEATKVARFLTDMEKGYRATLKLGERTDTLDSDGRVTEKKDVRVTEEEANGVLERFRGEITQVPPMYSALKRDGRPLYELAREGLEVEREGRAVNIYSLALVGFEPPFMEIEVMCSKGTYIRTLADDIGNALGAGAHITALRRTRIGNFRVEDSRSLEAVSETALIPIDAALSHLAEIKVGEREYSLLSKGTQIILSPGAAEGLSDGQYLRLKSPEGKLFAIGEADVKPPFWKVKINVERLIHI